MPSSTDCATSETASTMGDKQNLDAAEKPTSTLICPQKQKSRISRAASKLRAAVCLPNNSSVAASSNSATTKVVSQKGRGTDADADANTAAIADADPDQTMKSEFKFLDRKIDVGDTPYYVEREKANIDQGEKKDWWQLFAFCVVRRYDEDGDLDDTCLYVNPRPLRQLLKDVIGDYPSDPIDVDDVQITAPYHSLFHYRKQLKEVGLKRFADDGDTVSLAQMKLLLDWITSTFELEVAAHDRCLTSESKAIAYDKLWTLFCPGTIIHAKLQNQDRASRVIDYEYTPDDIDEPGLNITARFVDYDGDSFGERGVILFIPKFTGVREISSHDVKPLEFVEDADDIRQQLIARGRRFEELAAGQHFMEYRGIALKKNPKCPPEYLRFDATGRVMVDCKTYQRIDANDAIRVLAFSKKDRPDGKLTEADHLIANAVVRGFSMAAKLFLELSIDKMAPIAWKSQCFEELVLEPTTKETVQALVSQHSKMIDGEGFDDIVKGKGQGLVCVLHGPPGVGKTLTAECVAEYVQRPLFMVSSGDLGISSEQLDQKLTSIMDMASTWRAVLLIDEADVFLEQRALHDIQRNSMVSVFLRVLEYYTGIMFLTTNRVATFDDAFKSRIHVPIRYTDLSAASRLQIWRSFCSKVPGGVRISDTEYDRLAEDDLNGRQIKNVIKAAESLALFHGVELDFKQLQKVTKIQAMFEKDLTSFGEIDYTAPGSAKRHAASKGMYY